MTVKRILFVHEGDNWIRGSEQVLFDMIDTLPATDYAIKVCCSRTAIALIDELARRGIECVPLKLNSLLVYGGHNLFSYLKTCKEIFSVAHKFKADLIHASSGLSIQYCLPAAKLLRIPSITHVQGVYLKSSRMLSMVSFATRQLFVSKAIAAPFTAHRERQHIFYNGIDSEKFSPSELSRLRLRAELGVTDEHTVVGFVGSLERRKGIGTLFKMATALKELQPGLRFAVAGGGPLLTALIEERNRLGLQDRVMMLGERSDTPALLNAFDMLVCPSTSEAFGLVAAEAASTGLPVIASDVGGLPEIVQHGVNGYLCEATDAEDFTARCNELVQDKALRHSMGHNARATILSRFSMREFRKNLLELYDALLEHEPPAGRRIPTSGNAGLRN